MWHCIAMKFLLCAYKNHCTHRKVVDYRRVQGSGWKRGLFNGNRAFHVWMIVTVITVSAFTYKDV